MSAFQTQGYYLLTLETGINIASAAVREIRYKKPNGTTGAWSADLVGTTQISYQMDNTDLDVAGNWRVQAYVLIGGLNAFGDVVNIEVKPTI
jgi:hypothetical protein